MSLKTIAEIRVQLRHTRTDLLELHAEAKRRRQGAIDSVGYEQTNLLLYSETSVAVAIEALAEATEAVAKLIAERLPDPHHASPP